MNYDFLNEVIVHTTGGFDWSNLRVSSGDYRNNSQSLTFSGPSKRVCKKVSQIYSLNRLYVNVLILAKTKMEEKKANAYVEKRKITHSEMYLSSLFESLAAVKVDS
jgi:hypothetical protein